MVNILYIHGMGGGGDSRIPAILRDALYGKGVNVVVRTYDFDPETANGQITSLVDNLQPQLIIGESLGAIHALRVKGIPHLLIPVVTDPKKAAGALASAVAEMERRFELIEDMVSYINVYINGELSGTVYETDEHYRHSRRGLNCDCYSCTQKKTL